MLAKPSDIIHLMSSPASLYGIFAAAVTPLKADLSPDLEALPALLDFLAGRGCHGVLLLGTTGEGPSFAINERLAILRMVEQGKINVAEAEKLLAALEGKPFAPFDPGGDYLLIFNLGHRTGILKKRELILKGRIAFILKDYIDRKFMTKFQRFER